MTAKPESVSIVIAVPPEDVFARIGDLSRHEAFTDHFLIDWREAGPDHVNVRAKLPGPEDRADIDVIERDPPNRMVERLVAANGKRRAVSTWTLEPDGAGSTRVRFSTVQEASPAIERLLAPLLRRWIRRGNERALERLRDQAEGRTGA
ncbi:MAG TPA: SRPBCC family protein [Solirubrobacterales bacterium]|nr:SRPBCC family protein [Solirubrobacterales bacterium]